MNYRVIAMSMLSLRTLEEFECRTMDLIEIEASCEASLLGRGQVSNPRVYHAINGPPATGPATGRPNLGLPR